MGVITKLIAGLAVLSVSVAISVLTLIYGWGLQPQSWAAIILLGVVAQAFTQMLGRAILEDK